MNPKFKKIFNFKLPIATKFSIYILSMVLAVIVFLVISVKLQEKEQQSSFEYNIKLTSKVISESIKNAFVLKYYEFLTPLLEYLTEQQDIVYVIINSNDGNIIQSTIPSLIGHNVSQLGDSFSFQALSDEKLELRKNQDPFYRTKIENYKKQLHSQIQQLKKEYPKLRLVTSQKQLKAFLKEKQDLYNKNIITLQTNNLNINQVIEFEKLIAATEQMAVLMNKIVKQSKLLAKIDDKNTIYEVSLPLLGVDNYKYGNVRIGFSPELGKNNIERVYKRVIIMGLLFIFIGMAMSYYLASVITKPIGKLATGTEILGKGNLLHRIHIKTGDEIEVLSNRFNDMAQKLHESHNNLEQTVQERTREYLDATRELEKAYKKLQSTQAQLIQSEKMNSLGQLVAGVAHELNNPINFIYGNIKPLKKSINLMQQLINLFQSMELSAKDKEKYTSFISEYDYNFIQEDINDLVADIEEGAERAEKIIKDLKNFSRIDEAELKAVDIHTGIESTLNILAKQYKHKVTIYREYQNLPLIKCYASKLNQVWMNLLVNAFQSIKESGSIWIRTYIKDRLIYVEIEDNGSGIHEKDILRIFDPFFTTKPIGEGTGLGLSIIHSIITQHNGTIEVHSTLGKGTKFTIAIPL